MEEKKGFIQVKLEKDWIEDWPVTGYIPNIRSSINIGISWDNKGILRRDFYGFGH